MKPKKLKSLLTRPYIPPLRYEKKIIISYEVGQISCRNPLHFSSSNRYRHRGNQSKRALFFKIAHWMGWMRLLLRCCIGWGCGWVWLWNEPQMLLINRIPKDRIRLTMQFWQSHFFCEFIQFSIHHCGCTFECHRSPSTNGCKPSIMHGSIASISCYA